MFMGYVSFGDGNPWNFPPQKKHHIFLGGEGTLGPSHPSLPTQIPVFFFQEKIKSFQTLKPSTSNLVVETTFYWKNMIYSQIGS